MWATADDKVDCYDMSATCSGDNGALVLARTCSATRRRFACVRHGDWSRREESRGLRDNGYDCGSYPISFQRPIRSWQRVLETAVFES